MEPMFFACSIFAVMGLIGLGLHLTSLANEREAARLARLDRHREDAVDSSMDLLADD